MKSIHWGVYFKGMHRAKQDIRQITSGSLYNQVYNYLFFISRNAVHESRDFVYREVGMARRIHR